MEYKFRGKRIDNKEWVVGNYLLRHDSIGPLALIEVQDMEDFSIATYQVYPESMGMFIGLKDKTGKEIYEGDILKRTQHIDGNWVDRIFEKYEVAYNSSIASFEYKPMEGREYKQYTVRPFGGDELEITGNTNDYPYKLTPPEQRHPANMTDPKEGQEEVKEQTEQVSEQAPEVTGSEAKEGEGELKD